MRILLATLLLLPVMGSLAFAQDRKPKKDPLSDALLYSEQASVVFGQAVRSADATDYLRAKHAIDNLERALADTPYRGEAGNLRTELNAVTEGGGGSIPAKSARRLQSQTRELATRVRELMLVRLRYPVQDAPENEEGLAWRDELVKIMEDESLGEDEDDGNELLLAGARKVMAWLSQAIGWIFYLAPAGSNVGVALQILLSLVLLGVGLGLARVLILMLRRRKAEALARQPEAVPISSSRDDWSEAEAAAQRGDWKRALRWAHKHLLRTMELAGLTLRPSVRTDAEVLGDILQEGGSTATVDGFRGASAQFETHVYAGAEVTEDDWNRFRNAADRLERLQDPGVQE